MFCKIIGYPLIKPRSVILWKKFFKKKKLKINMQPFQIRPTHFNKEINQLFKNKKFLATAVTMPYKKRIISKIIVNDKLSNFAKAINFVIKKKNKVYGLNTDVYGALQTIKKFKKKNIIIYGFGGTGEAITRVFLNVYKKTRLIVMSNKKKPKDLTSKNLKFIKRKDKIVLSNIDIFINCSPLGSNLKKEYLNKSPLTKYQLSFANKNLLIFDIVYNPKKTLLSRYCKELKIKYVNGIGMNTFQAKLALREIYRYCKEVC
jgi:shikimate dehydrogenase